MSTTSLESFEFPSLLLPSTYGHLQYTPPDLEYEIKQPQIAMLDAVDVLNKDFGAHKLTDLCQVSSKYSFVFSYFGHNGPIVAVNHNSVSVDTKTGRKVIDINKYIERIQLEKPVAMIALADEVNNTFAFLLFSCFFIHFPLFFSLIPSHSLSHSL